MVKLISKAAVSQTFLACYGFSLGDDLADFAGASVISINEKGQRQALEAAKIKEMNGGPTLKGSFLYWRQAEFKII